MIPVPCLPSQVHVEGDDGSSPAPAAKSKVKGSKPTLAAGRQQLVITEVPYQTSKVNGEGRKRGEACSGLGALGGGVWRKDSDGVLF